MNEEIQKNEIDEAALETISGGAPGDVIPCDEPPIKFEVENFPRN